jgi:hypothetical protein
VAGLLATARTASARLDELRAAGLVRPATRLTPVRRPRSDEPDHEPEERDEWSEQPEPWEEPEGQTAVRAIPRRQPRLDELRAAGLVRGATEPAGVGVDQVLPVAAALRPLFPGGGLRRGGTVTLTTSRASDASPTLSASDALATGTTSLLFALLAEASAAGSWCAVVGLPRLGLVAAAEAGVALERLALVPNPGPEWGPVVAALLDGFDIVVASAPGAVSAAVTGRLAARARQRSAVLLPVGVRWPGADLTLEVVSGAWHGLEHGRGRLRRYRAEVLAYGRGAAARHRRAQLWLAGGPLVDAADGVMVEPLDLDLRLAG